jgi:hypothetical protein
MDRTKPISRGLAAVLGAGLAAGALYQLAAPLAWYGAVPGVVTTGPFNAHFVRDIGAAYLVAAAGLVAFAVRPSAWWPALACAAAFLTLHAGVHAFDAVCGTRPLADTARDFAGVHVVALVTLVLAVAGRPKSLTEPSHAESHPLPRPRPVREDLGL